MDILLNIKEFNNLITHRIPVIMLKIIQISILIYNSYKTFKEIKLSLHKNNNQMKKKNKE